MKHLDNINNSRIRSLLYKAIILLATVVLIVYFLPRDVKFSYEFDLNRPWKYGQLIADFDFPIYKSDDIIKHEQDSLLQRFHPYYIMDKEVGKSQIEQLRADYSNTTLRDLLPSYGYLSYIQRTLQRIYNSGIVSAADMDRMLADSVSSIMVIDDKMATETPLGQVYSFRTAYEQLLTGDSAHFSPEVLRRFPLNDYLKENLTYDAERTATAKEELLDSYSWSSGVVQSGQKIVERGQIIDQNTYNILESLKRESVNRSETMAQEWFMVLGQVIFVAVFVLLFMLYLDIYRKDFFNRHNGLLLIFSLMVIYSVVTSFMVRNSILSVYLLPYAMMPLILRVFLDSRTAFMSFLITVLICSIGLHYPYEFILLQTAAGLMGIFSVGELTQRSQIFRAVALVILTYVLVYFAYELVSETDVRNLNVRMYIYLAISGFLALFAYPLMFMVEKLFGFTSNVTMVELSNTNNPLLRRMSETAPGTFQHSLQVANLASEAAMAIGANNQLVRTGALYHDIGKLENPGFFTENQTGGVNPHANLSYEQSAQVVISHVTDGLKLAEKNNLPRVIRDFIATHHGKGKTKYFYISWKNEHGGQEPPEGMFSYPGPNPGTREQAILMMADAVEAASRSLKEYTEESIDTLVNRIIDSQVDDGFFRQCPITFKDIDTIKTVFKERLKSVYHPRISYPELKATADPRRNTP